MHQLILCLTVGVTGFNWLINAGCITMDSDCLNVESRDITNIPRQLVRLKFMGMCLTLLHIDTRRLPSICGHKCATEFFCESNCSI